MRFHAPVAFGAGALRLQLRGQSGIYTRVPFSLPFDMEEPIMVLGHKRQRPARQLYVGRNHPHSGPIPA